MPKHPATKIVEGYIPLAAVAGGAGGMVQLAFQPGAGPQHAAKLNPALTSLLDSGLYQAGMQGMAVAQNTLLKGKRPSLSSGHLTVVNPGLQNGVSEDHARSAELAICLSLLLGAASKSGSFIATGRVEMANGQACVRSVSGIRDKLSYVLEFYSQPGRAVPRCLFLPELEEDGESCKDKYSSVVQQIEHLGIKVHAVDSVHQALAVLGVDTFPLAARKKLWLIAAGVLVLGSFALLSYRFYLTNPLPLKFGTTVFGQTLLTTPARLAAGSAEGDAPVLPCDDGYGYFQYRKDDRMLVEVTASPGAEQLLMVAASEKHAPKVTEISQDFYLLEREAYRFALPITHSSATSYLAFIAARGKLDVAALQDGLLEATNVSDGLGKALATKNWLKQNFKNVLGYNFKVVEARAERCNGR